MRKKHADVVANTSVAKISLMELHTYILNSVNEGIHVVDLNGTVLVENQASMRMLGWPDGGLVGLHGHSCIHHHHADQTEYKLSECPIYATLRDGETRIVAEDIFWKRDGDHFPVTYSVAPLRDGGGKVCGATVVFRDITDEKAAAEKILRMAQYCSLTDLPNRALFSDRLAAALTYAERYRHKLALMFIDLDHFKPVNDRHGHDIGDALLREAALRMRRCLRKSDTVGRIGGDEFTVLLPTIETAQVALAVAAKLGQALREPFLIEGHQLHISASIGIALYPEHGADALSLTKHADQAMYLAKQAGRDCVRLYGG
jgi:diguanylate cyclase (GGDEF)-like protein/PAS domain S-box-containing protein